METIIWLRVPMLVGAVIVAVVLNLGFRLLTDRYLRTRKILPSSFEAKVHFSASFFWLALMLSFRAILPLMDLNDGVLNQLAFYSSFFIIFFTTWFLTRVVSLIKLISWFRLDLTQKNNLKERKIQTRIQFIEKLVLIFIYVVAAALILMNFEAVRKLGASLLASAGLAGIIVGFAAQKSLGNLIAGFQIAFTQPVRIDDVVIVEKEWGRIEEITLSYVVIRLWDKRALIVPINYFVEKPFENWTRSSADLLGVVYLSVDFKTPVDPLRKEFVRILSESPLWDQKIQVVQVTNFTEKSMELRFLMGARNAEEAFDLRCIVRERIIAYLNGQFPGALPQIRMESAGEKPSVVTSEA